MASQVFRADWQYLYWASKKLFDMSKILLPPLHIKLRLTKNIVKVMDKTGKSFQYFVRTFPWLSETTIIEGVWVSVQVCKIIEGEDFIRVLFGKGKAAWIVLHTVSGKN